MNKAKKNVRIVISPSKLLDREMPKLDDVESVMLSEQEKNEREVEN